LRVAGDTKTVTKGGDLIVDGINMVISRDASMGGQITAIANGEQISLKPQIGQNQPISVTEQALDLSLLKEASKMIADCVYYGPFRGVVGSGQNDYDLSLGEAFVKQWHEFKSGNNRENNRKSAVLTEVIRDMLGVKSLDINAIPDRTSLQLMINGQSYRIDEIGTGISQVILLLAHAALKSPPYIFIDEPELNLHPSLQLRVMEALGVLAKHGVVFTTHSLGLARSMGEHLYSVTMNPDDGTGHVSLYDKTRDLGLLLGEMGYSTYKELGFEKILLVEGVTDVLTMGQFVRQLNGQKNVVILPLGGASLINGNREPELTEVQRICTDVSVVIDSEKSSPDDALSPNRTAFVKVCEGLGVKSHVLKYRAIENYFTDDAIQRVKGEKYKALEPYQLLKDADLPWNKSDNWQIAREMNKDGLEADFLEFLTELCEETETRDGERG